MKTDLWKRTGESQLGYRSYALFIGICLFWTLLITLLGARIGYGMGPNFWISLIAFILLFAGVGVFMNSKNPLVSFLGVSGVGFLLGITIGPVLAYYNAEVILQALQVTLLITLGMSFFGILFPKFIMKASGLLVIGLLVLTISYWGQWLASLFGFYSMSLIMFTDYFAVLIFSGLIWFEWSRAMKLPRTIDNAIDASGGIAIDVVNLFMVLLRIFGRR